MKLVGFNINGKKKNESIYVFINPEHIQVIESNGDSCIIQLANGRTLYAKNISAEFAIERIIKSEPL